MARRRHLLPAASALLLVIALVGCSGGDASEATPPAAAAASSACQAAPSGTTTTVTSASNRSAAPEPTASTGTAPRAELPLVEFVRASGGSVCLPTEVLPRAEFTVGLSGRYDLDDRGMLFYFERPHRGSFWMKNTHVDLAIAFVSADSRIVELREMKAESLEYITPAADYLYAVEAQPGWFSRNGVAVGDEVRFDAGVVARLPKPE